MLCAHEARHISLRGSLHVFSTNSFGDPAQSCNILETLSNLLDLTEMDADDPQKVRPSLSLSKETVEAMSHFLTGKGGGGRQQPSISGGSLRS
jgi:hypothetical protein